MTAQTLHVTNRRHTDVAPGRHPARAGCHPTCGFAHISRDHHDRLLRIEEDPDALLDLLELALTWGELDYSGTRVIPPMQWAAFVAGHDWRNLGRVRRIFDLATDVALCSARAS